jgi:hypothetical protein
MMMMAVGHEYTGGTAHSGGRENQWDREGKTGQGDERGWVWVCVCVSVYRERDRDRDRETERNETH